MGIIHGGAIRGLCALFSPPEAGGAGRGKYSPVARFGLFEVLEAVAHRALEPREGLIARPGGRSTCAVCACRCAHLFAATRFYLGVSSKETVRYAEPHVVRILDEPQRSGPEVHTALHPSC